MAKKQDKIFLVAAAAAALAGLYFLFRKPSITVVPTGTTPLQSSATLPASAPDVSSIISRLATQGASSGIAPISAMPAPAQGMTLDFQTPGQQPGSSPDTGSQFLL